MATITVFDQLLTGNMGDGWRDDVAAAKAYAAVLHEAYEAYVRACYPGHALDVRIEVQRGSGATRLRDVVSDLSGRDELRLRDELGSVAARAWDTFCASEAAAVLMATEA